MGTQKRKSSNSVSPSCLVAPDYLLVGSSTSTFGIMQNCSLPDRANGNDRNRNVSPTIRNRRQNRKDRNSSSDNG